MILRKISRLQVYDWVVVQSRPHPPVMEEPCQQVSSLSIMPNTYRVNFFSGAYRDLYPDDLIELL